GIVPSAIKVDVAPKGATQQRYDAQGRDQFPLQRADESLRHRNTPALADGAHAVADRVAKAPILEAVAMELCTRVSHEILRSGTDLADHPPKSLTNCSRRWLFSKDADGHGLSAEMIEHDKQPMTKWPALRQGERQPGSPKAEVIGTVVRSTCQT